MSELHIVTGASSGVGRALAQLLAEQGRTTLALARRESELSELEAEQPEKLSFLAVDLGRPEAWDAVREHVAGQTIASLTHSAAIAPRGYLKDLDYERYHEVMAINFEAPLFLTQALLPHMAQGARVLNLSSGSAYRSMECHGLYSISKAALLMLYRAWSADFPDKSVVFGSAMPGVVEGPMQDRAREGDHPGTEVFIKYKESGMLIQPRRVADFLSWLLFDVNDEEFSADDWNIFDESHHSRWLDGTLHD